MKEDYVLFKLIEKHGEEFVNKLVRHANRKGYGSNPRPPLEKVSQKEFGHLKEWSTRCCKCQREIYDYEGFTLSGNICVATVNEDGQPFGGMLGNSSDNYQEAFCKVCFLKTISHSERSRHGSDYRDPPHVRDLVDLNVWLQRIAAEHASRNVNYNFADNFDHIFSLYQNGALSIQEILDTLNLPYDAQVSSLLNPGPEE